MSQGRICEYQAGQLVAHGYISKPESGAPKGGVLLIHEAPGLGPHMRRRADALAAQGYVALAADLHGEGKLAPGPDIARGWVSALKADHGELIARMDGALSALKAECGADVQNLAVAGFCFGGWCALELARSGADLTSVTVFHGSLASDQKANSIKGAVLVCTGDQDPFVPMEQALEFSSEMRSAGVDYQLCLYGGTAHGFTDHNAPTMPGFGYNAAADARSWSTFLNLLGENAGAARSTDRT